MTAYDEINSLGTDLTRVIKRWFNSNPSGRASSIRMSNDFSQWPYEEPEHWYLTQVYGGQIKAQLNQKTMEGTALGIWNNLQPSLLPK